MNTTVQTTRFGSLGPPKGPRRTPTSLTTARQTEVRTLIDTLINTVQLVEGPKKGGPTVFKVTMGPSNSEFTVQLRPDTTFVATRSDGQVVIDMFNNTWNFGLLSFGYTNKANAAQTVVTPDDAVVAKAKALSKKFRELLNPTPASPGFDV